MDKMAMTVRTVKRRNPLFLILYGHRKELIVLDELLLFGALGLVSNEDDAATSGGAWEPLG